MPKIIEIDGVGQVEFPDDMAEADILSAIERDILPGKAQPKLQPSPPTPRSSEELGAQNFQGQQLAEPAIKDLISAMSPGQIAKIEKQADMKSARSDTDFSPLRSIQSGIKQIPGNLSRMVGAIGGTVEHLIGGTGDSTALDIANLEDAISLAKFTGMNTPESLQRMQDKLDLLKAGRPSLAQDVASNPLVKAGNVSNKFYADQMGMTPQEQASKPNQMIEGTVAAAPGMLTGPLAPAYFGADAYARHLIDDYTQLKAEGMSDEEAADKALKTAMKSGALTAATFELLPPVFRRVSDKTIAPALVDAGLVKHTSGGFKKYLAGATSSIPENAALGSASVAAENLATGRPIGDHVFEGAFEFAPFGLIPRGIPVDQRRRMYENWNSEISQIPVGESVKGYARASDGSRRPLNESQMRTVEQVHEEAKRLGLEVDEVIYDPNYREGGAEVTGTYLPEDLIINHNPVAGEPGARGKVVINAAFAMGKGKEFIRSKLRHESGTHARLDSPWGKAKIDAIDEIMTPEEREIVSSRGYNSGIAEEFIAYLHEHDKSRFNRFVKTLGGLTSTKAEKAAYKLIDEINARNADRKTMLAEIEKSESMSRQQKIAAMAQARAGNLRAASELMANRSRIGEPDISYESNDVVPAESRRVVPEPSGGKISFDAPAEGGGIPNAGQSTATPGFLRTAEQKLAERPSPEFEQPKPGELPPYRVPTTPQPQREGNAASRRADLERGLTVEQGSQPEPLPEGQFPEGDPGAGALSKMQRARELRRLEKVDEGKANNIRFSKDNPHGQRVVEEDGKFKVFGASGKQIAETDSLLSAQKLAARDWLEKNMGRAESIYDIVRGNPDGFTIDPITGEKQSTGYVVAPSKLTESKFRPEEFTRESLSAYLDKFQKVFEENPGKAFFGGWRNGAGEFVLDVSFIFDKVQDALYVARNGKQDAIFHLDKFETIDTEPGIRRLESGGEWSPAERPDLRRIQEQLDSVIRGEGDAGTKFSKDRFSEDEWTDLQWWKQPARDERGQNRQVTQRRTERDLPKQLKPLPGQTKDGFVPLNHWSRFDLSGQSIDPRKYGTGYAGEEKVRRTSYPKDWLNRSYFGLAGYSKEQGLGKFKHTVEVSADRLYDIEADPLNLRDEAASIAAKKYGKFDEKAGTTIFERLINEAGYSGYFSRTHKIAAAFKAVQSSGRDAKFSLENPIPDRDAKKILGRAQSSKRTALDIISDPTVEPLKPPQEAPSDFSLSAEPQKKKPFSAVKAIANMLSTRALERAGGAIRGDKLNDHVELGRALADEAEYAVKTNSGAIGWYDSQMKEAWKWIEKRFPDLKGNKGKKSFYTALLSVTSNGQDVLSNFNRAAELYDGFLKTGKLETASDWGGVNADAINTGLVILERLNAKLGPDNLAKFLNSKFTVKEMRDVGLKIDGELSDHVAHGSLIFGPKVGGGFYQNLSGNFTPVTMDRWFMRTVNRMRGTLTESSLKAMSKQVGDFYRALPADQKAAMKQDAMRILKGIKNGEFDSYAERENPGALMTKANEMLAEFSKGGFRRRTKANMSAKNLAENMFGLNEAPESASERAFVRESVNHAQEILKKRGIEISNADLQAVLWYLEKDLYAKLGSKNKRTAGISYADAARLINEKQGSLFESTEGSGGSGDLRADEPSFATAGVGEQVGGRVSKSGALKAAGEAVGSIANEQKFSLDDPSKKIGKKFRDVQGAIIHETPPQPLPTSGKEARTMMEAQVRRPPIEARGMKIRFDTPDPATARKRGLRDNDPMARAIHALTESDRMTWNVEKMRFANMVENTIRQADYVLKIDRQQAIEGTQKDTAFVKGYSRNGVDNFHVVQVDPQGNFITQYSWEKGKAGPERILRGEVAQTGNRQTPQQAADSSSGSRAGSMTEIGSVSKEPASARAAFPQKPSQPPAGTFVPQGQPETRLSPTSSQARYSLDDIYKIFTPDKKVGRGIAGIASDVSEGFRAGFLSKFRPIDKLAEDIGKAYGVNTPKGIAGIFEQIKGSTGKGEADVYRFDRDVTKGVSGSEMDFNAYMFLRRGLDRLAQDAATGGSRRKVSNYTDADLRSKLTELENKIGPEKVRAFDQAASNYQRHMDNALRLQVESGRMSPDLYNAIKSGNQFYAPFKVLKYIEMTTRPDGTGSRIDTTADYTKAMKGIEDPDFKLGDMLSAARQMIVTSRILADKNVAMQKVANLSAFDAPGAFIKKLAPKEEAPHGMESVNVFENGEKNRYAVNKDVADALQIYQGAASNLIANVMSTLAVPFRAGATALNIPFQAVNLFGADLPRASLVSKYGIKHFNDFVSFPLLYGKALYSSIVGDVFGIENKMFLDFLDSGAAGATVQEHLTPNMLRYRPSTMVSRTSEIGKTILYSMPHFAAAIEQTSKMVGVQRAMKEHGATSGADLAKRFPDAVTEIRRFSGSPDFGRIGKTTQAAQLNLIWMFLNARIQGNSADLGRLGGADGVKPAAAMWTRIALAVGTPTVMLYLYNQKDENKEDYNNVAEREKLNYWHIPKYNEDGSPRYITVDGKKMRDYWRVPKRESAQWFANSVESMMDFAEKKDPESLKRFAGDMLENISPINVQGESATERMESAVAGLNPAIKAPIEVATGRDTYRHRDLVPDRLKNASPELQYTERTPKTFIAAAKAMPDVAPEFMRSPIMLENMTRSFTAGLFTQFMSGSRPVEGRSDVENSPLMKRFQAATYSEDRAAKEQYQKLLREASDESVVRFNTAMEIVKNAGTNSIATIARNAALQYRDEKLVRKIVDVWQIKQSGATFEETKIAGLPVAQRAEYVLDKISKAQPEAKQQLLIDLSRKRILTEEVAQEIVNKNEAKAKTP